LVDDLNEQAMKARPLFLIGNFGRHR